MRKDGLPDIGEFYSKSLQVQRSNIIDDLCTFLSNLTIHIILQLFGILGTKNPSL